MRFTIAEALVALAKEQEPELCQRLATLGQPDLSLIFLPMPWLWIWLDWVPDGVALRARVDQLRCSLPVELMRRLKAWTWRLIWLPDDLSRSRPFPEDRLAELTFAQLDRNTSEVVLDGRRYRVQVETEPKLGPEVTRVRDAMLADLRSGKCSPDDLGSNKNLIGHYNTSRSTYERARAAALAVFNKP